MLQSSTGTSTNVPLASDAAAARVLCVSKMTIWRWRHDRSPLPGWVAEILPDCLQNKVAVLGQISTRLRKTRDFRGPGHTVTVMVTIL